MDMNEQVQQAIQKAIHEGVSSVLTGYQSPITGIVKDAIKVNDSEIRILLYASVKECLEEESFRETTKQEVRRILARALIQKFGGEIESHVCKLKADPTTRARITLAIDEIIKGEVAHANTSD